MRYYALLLGIGVIIWGFNIASNEKEARIIDRGLALCHQLYANDNNLAGLECSNDVFKRAGDTVTVGTIAIAVGGVLSLASLVVIVRQENQQFSD